MQICCTKDLQRELGITAEAGLEGNDLFCWSAHIITINRRKAVLAVNDSNRFGFVLYGLKAKELKNLKELLLQGIRKCLADEKIKEDVIEKYLKSAGDLTFTRTRGPKYVGGISGYIEFLNIISNPEHEEYKHMLEWSQSQRYREFDIDLVNIRLKNILRFPVVF